MEYRFDRKISLNINTELNLYEWCLNEINNNNKVGDDYIPFRHSNYFLAQSFRVLREVSIKKEYNENLVIPKNKTTDDIEIRGYLLPDNHFIKYSMFGTDREINKFEIIIHQNSSKKVKELFDLKIISNLSQEEEWCELTGIIETKHDDLELPDSLYLYVFLNEKRFAEIVELIESKKLDKIRLRLGGVNGFYSYWSPSIDTHKIKVLTKDHIIDTNSDNKTDILRLGYVNEFNIYFESNFNYQSPIRLSANFRELEIYNEKNSDSKISNKDYDSKIIEDLILKISKWIKYLICVIFVLIMLFFLK